MRIDLSVFRGEIPRADRDKLPPGFAQDAQNTKLWSGGLRAFRGSRRVSPLAKTGVKRSLHLWGATAGGDAQGDIALVINTTPIQVNSPGHGRTTGDVLFISGTGLSIDDQFHVITVLNANSFTIDDSTAAGEADDGYWVKRNGFWFHWLDDVDVARSPIAGDTSSRVYYTGDGAPKMTYAPIATAGGGQSYPNNSYLLGVPAPASALSVTPGTGGGCDAADQITTVYVYTYVSEIGEEGPPSPPSALVTYCPGQTLDLSGMEAGPDGNYNITHKRIYRVPFGLQTFQFVGEIPVANTTFSDELLDSELGEDIPTADPYFDIPPEDMHSIGVLANGIGYGASKNEVCISAAFLLHGWPQEYRLSTEHQIVGLGAFDTNIVVCTEGVPYMITGHDPASLSMQKFAEFQQGCIAKRGIVGLDELGVVYPAPDGLALVGRGAPSVITRDYLTQDEWRALRPEQITAFSHDGRYFGFTAVGGFVFDPQEKGAGFIRLGKTITGGFKDLLTDSLYMIVDGFVERWEASNTKLLYVWKSGLIRVPHPKNFAFLRVFAESYDDLVVKIYGDGILRATTPVIGVLEQRLPDGFMAEEWEIELTGRDDVRALVMAETLSDLRAA